METQQRFRGEKAGEETRKARVRQRARRDEQSESERARDREMLEVTEKEEGRAEMAMPSRLQEDLYWATYTVSVWVGVSRSVMSDSL